MGGGSAWWGLGPGGAGVLLWSGKFGWGLEGWPPLLQEGGRAFPCSWVKGTEVCLGVWGWGCVQGGRAKVWVCEDM